MSGLKLWLVVVFTLFFYGWISNSISEVGRILTRRALDKGADGGLTVAATVSGIAIVGIAVTVLCTWLLIWLIRG